MTALPDLDPTSDAPALDLGPASDAPALDLGPDLGSVPDLGAVADLGSVPDLGPAPDPSAVPDLGFGPGLNPSPGLGPASGLGPAPDLGPGPGLGSGPALGSAPSLGPVSDFGSRPGVLAGGDDLSLGQGAADAAAVRVVALRAARVEDAAALAELYAANRDYLRPWEPARDEAYFTVEGQRDNLRDLVAAHGGGEMWAGVILVNGEIAGRITLNNILRGPLQSCFVGYWVARERAGRGVGSEALRLALDLAFGELGLHRVEAFTRVDNDASQAVLRRNGFEPVGVARRHIHVDGRWHDERLFERLAPWDDGYALYPPSHSG